MSILGDGEALWHKGLEAVTVPVWASQTGTVLRGEYGGRLSKMAGNRKNMSNIAKVKFLFAGNIWEQLIFIPF